MDTPNPSWQLIEATVPEPGAGTQEHVQAVTAALHRLDLEEIAAFDRFIRTQLNRAYRWDLWAVAYIAMGGCGDDGFEYFRLWLVAQGKDYFERALEDPQRSADNLKPGDDESGECELLLYAAQEAYEAKTGGRELPWDDSLPRRDEPAGEQWDEDSVDKLYPDLAKRFGWK